MALLENGPGTIVLGAADRAAALAAVKARLRVVSTEEDDLIVAFAESALGLAERVTGRALIVRSMTQRLTGCGGWMRLGAAPVVEIAGVADEAEQPLPLDSYALDIDDAGTGRVRIAAGQRVRITFSAGEATGWDTLPPPVREGVAMLAAHMFDDRAGERPVPAAVAALWRPFRTVRLGLERAMPELRP